MRVKHWQGYGSVDVKKLSTKYFTTPYGEKETKMVLRVKGNHECGLVRDDVYDVRRWIFNKFEKNFTGKDYEIDMTINDGYINENGIDVEVAIYTFVY